MTNNDLLAAAELVLKNVSANRIEAQLPRVMEAAILLARHVKAGADETALDIPWLRSECRFCFYREGADDEDENFIGRECGRGEGGVLSIALYVDDFELFVAGTGTGIYIKSRGQLLLLLRSLGIENDTTNAIDWAITERPQLLAEVERLKLLLSNYDRTPEEDRESMRIFAEAAAFRWLVENAGDVFLDGAGNEYFVHGVDDGSISEEPLGTGATPLEAIEDAKRRSES